ncbi:MAG: M56 family metallopeptidase [Gemmatimonadota bacterium]|nr:M56 family metallopeptidase [Gemmatimonadota bacterium]
MFDIPTPLTLWAGEFAATTLLDAAIASTVIFAAATAVALVLRRSSAASRHLVWTLTMVACLAVPAISGTLPGPRLATPIAELWDGARDALRSVAGPTSAPPTADAAREPAAPGPPALPAVPDVPVLPDVPAVPDAPPPPSVTDRAETPPEGTSAAGVAGWRTPSDGARDRVTGATFPLGATLTLVWLAGALFLLARVALDSLRLRWIERSAVPVAHGPLWHAVQRACLRLGVYANPVLLEGDDDVIPMTWGTWRPRILLPAGAEEWSDARLDAVLLHELGHVRRNDYLAGLVARVVCAVYWFQPLAWLGSRRMRLERELACDDLVVAAGHEGPTYADDLLEIATALRPVARVRAAALGMARPGHLRERVSAILDDTRARGAVTPHVRGLAIAAAVVATLIVSSLVPSGTAHADESVAPATPRAAAARFGSEMPPGAASSSIPEAPPIVDALPPADRAQEAPPALAPEGSRDLSRVFDAPPPASLRALPAQEAMILCGPADGEARRRSTSWNDDRGTIEAEFGDCRSRVDVEGEIEFTPDFSGIARMSSGARLRIEVDRDGARERLDAEPGDGGRPDIRWTVDGRDRPFDAAGERWLAQALTDVFRSSGYMARERAAWLVSEGGSEAVLDEVELMFSDHAQATYLSILLEEGSLSSTEVRSVIEVAGRQVDSDHSLGEVLLSTARSYTFDGQTRAVFLQAATSIDSDHTQGRVFEAALTRGDLSQENLEALLETAASSIESDHTLGELLIQMAGRYGLEPGLRAPYLRAARTIGSDHTQGRVYEALLTQQSVGPTELAAVLEAASEIESDHTLSELLIRVSRRGLDDATLQRAYLRSARSIQSDHSMGEALNAFSAIDGVGTAELVTFLEVARDIGSDHTLSEVLAAFAGRHEVEGEVRDAYLVTLEEIGSRHARERAAAAIARG